MSIVREVLELAASRRSLVEVFPYADDLDSLLVWRILEVDGARAKVIDYDLYGNPGPELWEEIGEIVRIVAGSEYLGRMEKLIERPSESLGRTSTRQETIAEWLREAAETGEIVGIKGPSEEILIQVHRVMGGEFAFQEVDENTGKTFPGRFAQRISMVEAIRVADWECQLWNAPPGKP